MDDLADAAGYSGSIALQLGKDLLASSMGRQAFFEEVTLWVSGLGVVSCVGIMLAFGEKAKQPSAVENR